jgi:fatty acid-binding protein DegV
VSPSAIFSDTLRSASVGAQDFPEADIRIVDTQTSAGRLGTLVLEAHQLAAQGVDLRLINQAISEMASRGRVFFLVDTLEYLH